MSTGLVCGVVRIRAENFSFALAVVQTPADTAKEALRLYHASAESSAWQFVQRVELVVPSSFGMVLSFLRGLLVLRWLGAERWNLSSSNCIVKVTLVYWLDV